MSDSIFGKAYEATQGVLVKVDSNEMAKRVLTTLLFLMGCSQDSAENVIKKAFEFYDETDEAVITHIICNMVMKERHISLIIGTKKNPVPKNLDTEDGIFAYVYNADCTYDSELGYIFLEKINDEYHRIG